MARIRTIKPEFWTDERIGELSVTARLLFIATWNVADDHGGLDRSAKQLKAQAFPYDNIDCEPLIQELLQAGRLVEYEAGGKKYLHIKGFRTHQKVEKPSKNRVPLYEENATAHRGLTEDSPTSSGSSLGSLSLGREGKGNGKDCALPAVAEDLKTRTPAGEMAIALRDLGVKVTSMDLVLAAWVRDGFTVQQVTEATELARMRKPYPEPIPAAYLDPILRKPQKPPTKQVDRVTWRPPPDDEVASVSK